MPAREVGVDAVAEAAEPEVVEARDLGLGEALVRDVRERRPAPERERVHQGRGRRARIAAGELLATEPAALLEALGVERPRREAQAVATARGRHDVIAECGLQARGQHLDGVARVLRSLALPQLVGDALEWTAPPRRTSSSARSERVRPRGTRARAPLPRRPRSDRGS